ncbi:hypothetical protein C2G38_2051757 [Gigaspora rosea]|uniref:Uncharacterized protein n=1 Tax=Gigaspora rosea TaxID=44941 RepID=A0A397TQ43_9GLOM|nr:hypothetical protein C2G38_2051757 [Gigaspora rosea]
MSENIMKMSENNKKDMMKMFEMSEDNKKDMMKISENNNKDMMKMFEDNNKDIMKMFEDNNKEKMKIVENLKKLSEEKSTLMIQKNKKNSNYIFIYWDEFEKETEYPYKMVSDVILSTTS